MSMTFTNRCVGAVEMFERMILAESHESSPPAEIEGVFMLKDTSGNPGMSPFLGGLLAKAKKEGLEQGRFGLMNYDFSVRADKDGQYLAMTVKQPVTALKFERDMSVLRSFILGSGKPLSRGV